MILVRDVFQLHFGKTREAVALLGKGIEILRKDGYGPARVLTDLTGPYYNVVLESTYESLGAFEGAMRQVQKSEKWHEWYRTYTPLVASGHREIFNVSG